MNMQYSTVITCKWREIIYLHEYECWKWMKVTWILNMNERMHDIHINLKWIIKECMFEIMDVHLEYAI